MEKVFQLFKQVLSYEKVPVQELSVPERLLVLQAIRLRLVKIQEFVDDKIFEYEELERRQVVECGEVL